MAELKENPFLVLRNLYAKPETEQIHQQMVRWMRMTLGWVDHSLSLIATGNYQLSRYIQCYLSLLVSLLLLLWSLIFSRFYKR